MTPRTTRDTQRAAMDLLARRAWTTAELRARLLKSGHEPDRVDEALATCAEKRWLDDAAFARDAAASLAAQGHAAGAIAQRLARRGIDADLAESAAGDAIEAIGAPMEQAVALARKHIARQADTEPAVLARRVAAALARRGHDEETVREALRVVELPVD